MKHQPTISVVIPCYNQAHFLVDAIASVEEQDYPAVEIIIVDDGSRDDTAQVAAQAAAKFANVSYILQENRGLSAARNTGLAHSQSDMVLFLDADDRLLPGALTAGATTLQAHPECAFVYGHYRLIDADGNPLPTWREQRSATPTAFTSGSYEQIGPDGAVHRTWRQQTVTSDHYAAMLQRNVIVMHATVLYQRWVFAEVGNFDPTLRACEDYDLYLRIVRCFPVASHDGVVAEYRLHGRNMTGDPVRMLQAIEQVLARQRPLLDDNPHYTACLEAGLHFWRTDYGRQAVKGLPAAMLQLPPRPQHVAAMAKIGWPLLADKVRGTGQLTRYRLRLIRDGLRRTLRHWQRSLRWGSLVNPVANGFVHPASTYMADFLQQHTVDLHGRILLVGECALPKAASGVDCDSWRADAVLPAASYDAVVVGPDAASGPEMCTAVADWAAALKPGGVLLLALPGVVAPQHGWGFTTAAAQLLVKGVFAESATAVSSYGNVQAAAAAVLRQPDADLSVHDPQFPVLVTVAARHA